MRNHMVIGQSSNNLSIIVGPKVACQKLLLHNHLKLNTVNTVFTKPSIHSLEGTRQNKIVNSNYRNNNKIPEEHKKSRESFLEMLELYQTIWHRHLGTLNTTTHRIELHSAFFRAGPKARQSQKDEIDRLLKENVIEPSQKEWASPATIVPKMIRHYAFPETIET